VPKFNKLHKQSFEAMFETYHKDDLKS